MTKDAPAARRRRRRATRRAGPGGPAIGPGAAPPLGDGHASPPTWPAATAAETPAVLALADGRPELLEPLVPGLPYLRAEAVYAARHEMA